jgi:hypothetical protein
MSARKLREQAALCLRLADRATASDTRYQLTTLAKEYQDAAERLELKQKAARDAAAAVPT